MIKYNLNNDWRFHLGDIKTNAPTKKEPVVAAAKTRSQVWGPSSETYCDESNSYGPRTESVHDTWEVVNLPHDFMIDQIPSKDNNEAHGFVEYKNAWYRKHFTLKEGEACKRIVLFFEGVTCDATIYINGCLAGRNFDGHASFEVDISDYVYEKEENLISVYVSTERHEGWWYSGGGIYRNVWLEISEKVSIDRYGVYVNPKLVVDNNWEVPVETTLRNDSNSAEIVSVKGEIIGENDQVVAVFENSAEIPAYSKITVDNSVVINNPRRWDTEDPFLYKVNTVITQNGKVLDKNNTRFGFREVKFDVQNGLMLNGRYVKIKGVCCHQDFGLTGIAVPASVQRHKLELMREMGANGFRTVHYPHDTATMDALDELGFLVMDETRWFIANNSNIASLEWLIKRDRNRPSVIMWSIGNEEFITLDERGKKIANKMKAAIKRLDDTRPVTMAVSLDPLNCKVFEDLDLIGINYSLEMHEAIHNLQPNKPFFASECCSTGSTRGWYFDDSPKRGYVNEFDKDFEFEWSRSIEETWKHISARPWVFGAFQWTGIEYRGECVWPRICAQTGAVDLFLIRKAAFYQNKANWTKEPMIYVLPHWNHQGMEGEDIYVRAYTNCEEAALYLDDELVGRVSVEKYGHAEWRVPYKAGRITVKGYINGKVVANDYRETTTSPVALKLCCEMAPANDGYAIVNCYAVDDQGREVPNAETFISFDCDGGVIVATGSDVSDHTPPACPDRKMRAGKCAALVKLNSESEQVTVYARSFGLKTAYLKLAK